MHEVNIDGVDLNLLRVLEVLLAEQNVTRAAERLGRSQPAVSHALSRLRDLFDDPLLVPGRGGMKPTPLAERLAIPLERALMQVRGVLSLEAEFDPAQTTRVFSLGCPDAFGVLLGDVLGWMRQEAPEAKLRVEFPDRAVLEQALEVGRFDVALGPLPSHATTSLEQRSVGSVTWSILGRKDHPFFSSPMDASAWVEWPHVVVESGSRSDSAIGRALAQRGLERTIGLIVPGFLLGGRAVAASDLLFAAPDVVAQDAVSTLGLTACPVPIETPRVHVAVMWHERWSADPGHRWFREGLTQVTGARWLAAHPAR